jgi:hypothetical protein
MILSFVPVRERVSATIAALIFLFRRQLASQRSPPRVSITNQLSKLAPKSAVLGQSWTRLLWLVAAHGRPRGVAEQALSEADRKWRLGISEGR